MLLSVCCPNRIPRSQGGFPAFGLPFCPPEAAGNGGAILDRVSLLACGAPVGSVGRGYNPCHSPILGIDPNYYPLMLCVASLRHRYAVVGNDKYYRANGFAVCKEMRDFGSGGPVFGPGNPRLNTFNGEWVCLVVFAVFNFTMTCDCQTGLNVYLSTKEVSL